MVPFSPWSDSVAISMNVFLSFYICQSVGFNMYNFSYEIAISRCVRGYFQAELLYIYGTQRDKTCLLGFQQSETQTSLLSYRTSLRSYRD